MQTENSLVLWRVMLERVWLGLLIVKRQLLGGWRLEQLRPTKEVRPRDLSKTVSRALRREGDRRHLPI
jgi:hypothetical protein